MAESDSQKVTPAGVPTVGHVVTPVDPQMVGHVIVTARNEADRIGATVMALREVFSDAQVIVADDGSTDETAMQAVKAGAQVVSRGKPLGKGQAASLAAARAIEDHRRALELGGAGGVAVTPRQAVVLCDADLADSALLLNPLVKVIAAGEADLTVAVFARKQGGGFGLALGFAHWAIRRRCGLDTVAPISGQRAMTYQALAAIAPFRNGFGMEIGMTVDAVRAGLRVREIELDLAHRSTGRTLRGFLHRGRQLLDFLRVYWATRGQRSPRESALPPVEP